MWNIQIGPAGNWVFMNGSLEATLEVGDSDFVVMNVCELVVEAKGMNIWNGYTRDRRVISS